MSYYSDYIAALFKPDIPEGWEKTQKGYRKGKVEIRLQKDKPEKGWNAAVFRNGKIVSCWYSCMERAGIMIKVRELVSKV